MKKPLSKTEWIIKMSKKLGVKPQTAKRLSQIPTRLDNRAGMSYDFNKGQLQKMYKDLKKGKKTKLPPIRRENRTEEYKEMPMKKFLKEYPEWDLK